MASKYNDDGIRDLAYAIYLSGYDALVSAFRAVNKARKHGSAKSIELAEYDLKYAIKWFDGDDWQNRIIIKAKELAESGDKMIKKRAPKKKRTL